MTNQQKELLGLMLITAFAVFALGFITGLVVSEMDERAELERARESLKRTIEVTNRR